MLPIARAALEQMAGAGTLDTEALVDLAEVRWRSGDLEGAAEAARAHQSFGGQEPIADLILAEALLHAGRQPEARHHVEVLASRVGPAIDLLFAGEGRSGSPPGAQEPWVDAGAGEPGRFGLLVGGREVASPTPDTWRPLPSASQPVHAPAASAASAAARIPDRQVESSRPGEQVEPARRAPLGSPVSGRTAGHELEAVERLLAEGRHQAATERLAVLLRLDPALAPIVLSLADRAVAAGRAGAEGLTALHVVRGDAYRSMGREIEADAAYKEAMRALPARPETKEPT